MEWIAFRMNSLDSQSIIQSFILPDLSFLVVYALGYGLFVFMPLGYSLRQFVMNSLDNSLINHSIIFPNPSEAIHSIHNSI